MKVHTESTKVLCKKTHHDYNYTKNVWYEWYYTSKEYKNDDIKTIINDNKNVYYFHNDYGYWQFNEYFYTEKELRQLKLKQLDESIKQMKLK